MSWNEFIYFAAAALVLWFSGVVALYLFKKRYFSDLLISAGLIVFASFIVLLWIWLKHPPLRTMGETRLWYSFFLVIVGYLTYLRWRYKWLVAYSTLVSAVFILINLLKPEIHTANLMPALQSPWFVPHVTVYILAYAMMGAATIAALIALYGSSAESEKLINMIDNLVYIGLAFLMAGILMGALWAKAAWGDYWSWDIKETWALITVCAYLLYIHSRRGGYSRKITLWIIPIGFVLLMITWLGVSYLPAAQGSIHVY
ncbi:MAG: cytochrome C assembly protein [Bacteroidetes bacterium GWF2_40_14]|nr:MAG: cytochrome C assembly protein [Bacteroidetes bacterium GWF2_40_14]